MSEKGKFGVQEAICLMVIAGTTKVFYTSPSAVSGLVGTAGWYMTLISAAVGALGFTFVYLLIKRYPGKNIMEVYDKVLGKFFGSVLSFILFLVLFLTSAVNTREHMDVLKINVFPNTPISFIMFFFILTVVILSYLGIETIARYSRLVIYILLASFLIALTLSANHFEVRRLFPLYGYGLGNTIYHGLVRSSLYGDFIMIAVIAKYLHGHKDVKKAGFISLAISAAVISISLLAFSLTFSYSFGSELVAPMYVMVSLIKFGIFFTRIESLFVFLWSINSLISISVLFYVSLLIYCHIFSINDRKPLILPYAILLFTTAMIPEGFDEVFYIYMSSLRNYGWIGFYIPVIIALAAAIIRKKGGKEKDAEVQDA